MGKKSGFSILELTVVIAISGMIMTGMIGLLNTINANNKAKANKEKLTQLKVAINQFMRTRDRLPCPANPTLASTDANYGVEAINTTTGLCDYTLNYNGTQVDAGFQNHVLSFRIANTVYPNISHKIIFGTIPFKTLGLAEGFMYDEYSNKITYLAVQGYATDRKKSTLPVYQRINGWSRVSIPARMHRANPAVNCSQAIIADTTAGSLNDNFCLERTASSCRSATNVNPIISPTLIASGIQVVNSGMIRSGDAIINACRWDIRDYLGNYITRENLAYSLISHGKNGFGAWNRSGVLNSDPTSLQEKRNTFNYYHTLIPSHNLLANSSNSIEVIQDLQQADFDDDVIFQTTSDILLDVGREKELYCHQSMAFIDIPAGAPVEINCNIWFPTMNTVGVVSQTRMTNPANNTGCTTSSRRMTCAPSGVWTNPI